MFGNKRKPVRIYTVLAVSKESGELFVTRAFNYKCDAKNYANFLQCEDYELITHVEETILY